MSSGPIEVRGQRSLTPAVAAAAVFAILAGLFSVAFVAARGGLELPIASERPVVGLASASPAASGSEASLAPSGTPAPLHSAPSSALPSTPVTSEPPASLAPASEPAASTSAASAQPSDPLLALPRCPARPGCFEDTVRRGDTVSGISDRYGVPLWITLALNPELPASDAIVVGETLFLARDPEARLASCPGGAACRLYVVGPGDSLSRIADRYRISMTEVLALNPGLEPSAIVVGQTLRLPLFG